MRLRVLTIRYNEGLQGFPEDAIREVCAGKELLEVREYFFMHGNLPHLSLVLLLSDEPARKDAERRSRGPDPGESLPDEVKPLYRQLREWRNARAKQEGRPSYVIARNAQLAEICLKLPRSKAALKEVEGIGEATCKKYGDEILGMMPETNDTDECPSV